MDIRQLRTFAILAETGSLGKAADRLRVAQPALSRQIRLLEEDIGWVTPPEDPSALAKVIAKAAEDATGTTEKGRRAARVALQYTRQISFSAYRNLMDRLLESRILRRKDKLEEEAA